MSTNKNANPNENPEKMTNTQRIALGLAPLGSPQSKTPTQRMPSAGDTKQFQTQRIATGNTQRIPVDQVPISETWAMNPSGAYKPGQTQRIAAPQIAEKKRVTKFQLALIMVVPTLVVCLVSLFLLSGPSDEVVQRRSEEFSSQLKPAQPGSGSINAQNPSSPTDPSNPSIGQPGDPSSPAVSKDITGTPYVKSKYSTSNVEANFPLEYSDPQVKPTELPTHTMQGGIRIAPGMSKEQIQAEQDRKKPD